MQGLKNYKFKYEAIAENQRYMKHCKLCFKNNNHLQYKRRKDNGFNKMSRM